MANLPTLPTLPSPQGPPPDLYGSGFSNQGDANSQNQAGEYTPVYGGYKGGFSDTMNMEQGLAAGAGLHQAPTANFGAANSLQGIQNAYGKQQMGLASSMGQQAQQMQALAAGHGKSASDYAFTQALGGNVAGAQSAAAAGGNPLAQHAAMAGMGAANLGASSGYGGAKAGEMQAAQAGLTNIYGNQGSLYGQAGTQGLSGAQMAAQQAQFDPTLQASQQKLNDAAALGYTNAGLGLQQQEQGVMSNAQAAQNAYELAEFTHQQQQTAQFIGGLTSAFGYAGAML